MIILKKENKKKQELFVPNASLILALIYFLIGAFPAYSYRSTVKRCTSETKGIVVSERHRNRRTDDNVQSKYTSGKYQKEIKVETDGRFNYEYLYAGSSVGKIGDEVIIRYDPDDPDEYYFADYYSNGRAVAVLSFGISGSMIVLSLFLFIYYNRSPRDPDNKKDDRT